MKTLALTLGLCLLFSCQPNAKTPPQLKPNQSNSELDTATFAGGCFWCIEAAFEQIKGVESAVSGYAGGKASDASYDLVSAGRTSHAETVQIYYDPKVLTYETLLAILFTAHDPTQINRQGPDIGYQYRSAIFYHSEAQKKQAESAIAELEKTLDKPIATELTPFTQFYRAENYHQDYEKLHPYNPYILNVSKPKIERVAKKFSHLLK